MSEISVQSLQPSNAGPFERAMSVVNAGRMPRLYALIEIIRTLWDPWNCPAEQLPLLAWAWSVDIWNEAWTLERKRLVVAEARVFHIRKTTVSGYRMALGYVDAELRRTHLPRDGFFAGRSPTPEAHEAWLQTLPEVRIYENAPRTKPGRKGFFADRNPVHSAAKVVLEKRRAELRRNGAIISLAFAGIRTDSQGRILAEAEHLVIPAPARKVFKAGGFVGSPAGGHYHAAQRVITLSFASAGDPFIPNAIAPTLVPAEVTPRRVAEAKPAGLGFFANRPQRHRGVMPNLSDDAYYLSIRLVDREASEPRSAASHLRNVVGKSRLRRRPFTASLLVHAPEKPRRSFPVSGRVARSGPEPRLREIEHAIGVTQAARDTLFYSVNSTRPLTYGDFRSLGSDITFGVSVLT